MKKLFIALGCFATIIVTSSCTTDNPVEVKKENLITPTKIPDPGTGIFADDLDNPIPPKK